MNKLEEGGKIRCERVLRVEGTWKSIGQRELGLTSTDGGGGDDKILH